MDYQLLLDKFTHIRAIALGNMDLPLMVTRIRVFLKFPICNSNGTFIKWSYAAALWFDGRKNAGAIGTILDGTNPLRSRVALTMIMKANPRSGHPLGIEVNRDTLSVNSVHILQVSICMPWKILSSCDHENDNHTSSICMALRPRTVRTSFGGHLFRHFWGQIKTNETMTDGPKT